MLQLTGHLNGVRRDPRTDRDGKPYEATTYIVACLGATYYVDKYARDFGDDPEPGTEVTIEVSPRPYVRKDGSAGCGWRAIRNLTAAKGARVASPA